MRNSILRFIAACGLALTAALSCNLLEEGSNGKSKESESIEDIAAKALSINQARERVGEKGIWVEGYIVGGDLSAKAISFTPPFSSASNLAIGPEPDTQSREDCMSVSLPSGKIREALNLAANPDNLGRHVFLKGEISASYFSLIGIKGLNDYRLE